VDQRNDTDEDFGDDEVEHLEEQADQYMEDEK
jgi:hypothetical protein